MAEPTYDPYAYSDIGKRALGGEYIDSMNFFWFDPVTGEEGQTTEGWSRVPDSAKPYTYLEPTSRNQAKNTFYESGAAFGGVGGLGGLGGVGGVGGGGLLSGQAYAQQIAGGMPFEQVVAPGMSFSPDQPMGYTAQGATPFQPRPAFFPSVQDPSVGMTGADLGLPMGTGTPMPAGTTFDPDSVRQIAPVAPAGVSASAIANRPVSLEPLDIEGLLANVDVDKLLKNIGLQTIPEPQEKLPVESLLSAVEEPVFKEPLTATLPTLPTLPTVTPLQIQEPIGVGIPEMLDIPMQTFEDLPLNLGLPMIEQIPQAIPQKILDIPQLLEPVATENLGLPQINIPDLTSIATPMATPLATPTVTPLAIPEVTTPVVSAQLQEKIDRLSKNMMDAMGINIPQVSTPLVSPIAQTIQLPSLNPDETLASRFVELPTAANLGLGSFGLMNPVANVESIVAPLATNKVGMTRER